MVSVHFDQSLQRDQVATQDDDRHSTSTVASTVATTASLASRIAGLALDFADKLHEPYDDGSSDKKLDVEHIDRAANGHHPADDDGDSSTNDGGEDEEQEDEEVVEIAEDELLRLLDNQEPPFDVCSRLFYTRPQNPLQLRRLTMFQVEELRQNGYLVVDNFVPRDVAARIKAEALNLLHKGRFQEAGQMGKTDDPNDVFTDRTARNDWIMWLHVGQPPADTSVLSPLMVAFQELQEDLAEVMRLRQRTAEYQLAYYPATGARYHRHRDALPDDGSEEHQRRLTAIVYCNADWDRESGGVLRVWPPRRKLPCTQRSPSVSEAGTSFSEYSDASFRSHPQLAGSITSSMLAEASTQHDHDASSLDGVSVAGSEIPLGGIEWVEVDGEMCLEVAPLAGRLVLFLSGAVDHAVMPSFTDRVAVTAWCQ